MGQAGFWDNNEKAQATVAELKSVNSILKPLDEALAVGRDLEALEELAREDGSLEGRSRRRPTGSKSSSTQSELDSLLSGPHDACRCPREINARDGGTDANDWAEMLLRMYSAWAAGTTMPSNSSTARTTPWPASRAPPSPSEAPGPTAT
jgi:peptide chain release factor 2